jgi:pimeloyl-ACP methyl ester carboxylesterase
MGQWSSEMKSPASIVKKPDIVCLHGSASSGRQWHQLIDKLGRHYRVVTPDLIGHGGHRFDTRTRLRLDDEVDVVLGQLGETTAPFHLIAHGYGGAVALRLACRYPQRVASLTLYEPAHFLSLFEDGLSSAEARELRKLHTTVVKCANSKFGRWRSAREFVNYAHGSNLWKQLTALEKRRCAAAAPIVAAEFSALMVAGARLDDLSALTMPVRILCGTRTRRTAKRICELLADRIPGALMHWLDGLKHMAPVTDATPVNTVIAELITGTDAPVRSTA